MIVMKHEKSSTDSNGNVSTHTCIEPLFCALVTDKKTDTYSAFWQNMINLHAHYYPDEGRLQIGKCSVFITDCYSFDLTFFLERISFDFERAMVNATLKIWPNIDYTYCAFHLVQACGRKFKSYYGVSHPNSSSMTKEVHQVTAAIPYVPWNSSLVPVFVDFLRKNCSDYYNKKLALYEKEENEAKKLKAKAVLERAGKFCHGNELYIRYIESQFLNEKHFFGYPRWGYSQADTDRTNNKCESANGLLKTRVDRNPKRYIKGVGILYDFLSEFITTPFDEVSFHKV